MAESFHELLDKLAEQFKLLKEQNGQLIKQNSQLVAMRRDRHTLLRTPASTPREPCPWSVTTPHALCGSSLFDEAPMPIADKPAQRYDLEESETSSEAQDVCNQSCSAEHNLTSFCAQEHNKTSTASTRIACLDTTASELVLLPAWSGPRYPSEMSTTPSGRNLAVKYSSLSTIIRFGDAMRDQSRLQRFVVQPSSRIQITWDLLSVVVMGYDTLSIPMQVFNLAQTEFALIMNWIVTLFWSADLLLSFFVGFHSGGVVELRPVKIARRYLRTWFPLDICILTTDWIIALSDSSSMDLFGIIRISKSLRIVRVLRAFRLFRLVKVIFLISEFTEFITSENLLTFLGVAKLMICILLVNHFIACGWYFIGTLDVHEGKRSWVLAVEKDWGGEPPVEYSYTTSFHWSLTQFTPASMEVVPRNTVERIYTAFILILALVMFSSFVSSITSAMTRLHETNLERRRQRERVRRYIHHNKVSLQLGNRINSFLKKQGYVTKVRATMSDIAAFKLLPEPLKTELHREVFMPYLLPHPFFHHLYEVDRTCITNYCHLAMSEQSVLKGQVFFRRGEQATQAFFITAGVSKYFFGVFDSSPTEISHGAFVCEMCLWLRWQHRGQMFAAPFCEFLTLESSKFAGIAAQAVSYPAMQLYAQHYLECLTRACKSELLSDVWSSFDASQEMAQRSFEMFLQEQGEQIVSDGVTNPGIFKRMQGKLRSFSMRTTISSALAQLHTFRSRASS